MNIAAKNIRVLAGQQRDAKRILFLLLKGHSNSQHKIFVAIIIQPNLPV